MKICLEIVLVFVLKNSSEKSRDTCDENIEFVMADSRVFLSASTALNDLLMSQIHRPEFEVDINSTIKEINSCINYLVNGSVNLVQNPPIQVMYLLMVQMTYQVTETEIRYNQQETQLYGNIFHSQLIPTMNERKKEY